MYSFLSFECMQKKVEYIITTLNRNIYILFKNFLKYEKIEYSIN